MLKRLLDILAAIFTLGAFVAMFANWYALVFFCVPAMMVVVYFSRWLDTDGPKKLIRWLTRETLCVRGLHPFSYKIPKSNETDLYCVGCGMSLGTYLNKSSTTDRLFVKARMPK